MKAYTTKTKIRTALLDTLSSPQDGMMFDPDFGVRVRATSMESGNHHYWLTGTADSYEVHCYGSGRGWCDRADDCGIQDLGELVDYLWKNRKHIIEDHD